MKLYQILNNLKGRNQILEIAYHEWHGYHSAPLSFWPKRSEVEKYHSSMVQKPSWKEISQLRASIEPKVFSICIGAYPHSRWHTGEELIRIKKSHRKRGCEEWAAFLHSPFLMCHDQPTRPETCLPIILLLLIKYLYSLIDNSYDFQMHWSTYFGHKISKIRCQKIK